MLFEAVVKWTKIHVQIMRFTCCLNMDFNFTKTLTEPETVSMMLHAKALWPWLIILPIFLFAKTLQVSMTLWRCNDIQKFDADAILFREIQCKKMDILMFKQCFQCVFEWKLIKYARIVITYVCFIALTLAGFLGLYLNTRSA